MIGYAIYNMGFTNGLEQNCPGVAATSSYTPAQADANWDGYTLYHHKVKPGESLSSIAPQYGTSAKLIQQANGISNPNLIQAGANLRIPVPNP